MLNGLALAAPTLVVAGAAAQAPAPVSRAEQLIFVEPQLRELRPPLTLRYRFEHSGSQEAAWADDVRIELSARPDGVCCAADGRFLSERRALALPAVEAAVSNPITLYFLEYDVREMQRLTKGQQAHFRRRIRLALADAAEVGSTTVRHGGRDWPATTVRIRPYLDDPYRPRFERYAGKEYWFVLAPGVPGSVYQLRTRVPAPAGGAPLIEDILTLTDP